MPTQPAYFTPDQYLEIERKAEFRSEYINGEMFAMSGGTPNHARIVVNAVRRLDEQLDGRPCEAFGGDLRVFSAKEKVFTYPDILVVCGPQQLLDNRRDTLTDATVIIEVLSPSTKNAVGARRNARRAPRPPAGRLLGVSRVHRTRRRNRAEIDRLSSATPNLFTNASCSKLKRKYVLPYKPLKTRLPSSASI
jgi:hypothetical protein